MEQNCLHRPIKHGTELSTQAYQTWNRTVYTGLSNMEQNCLHRPINHGTELSTQAYQPWNRTVYTGLSNMEQNCLRVAINEPKDFCGPPPHLINGDTMGRTRECYRNRESVHYDCQSYYTLNSLSSYKTCPNGIWIGEMTCLKPGALGTLSSLG
uniref:Sushi domain-containing protein n=1 Tax=Hucho hucho TaxID=62062 RepID=A0A4W5KKG7_9TELE